MVNGKHYNILKQVLVWRRMHKEYDRNPGRRNLFVPYVIFDILRLIIGHQRRIKSSSKHIVADLVSLTASWRSNATLKSLLRNTILLAARYASHKAKGFSNTVELVSRRKYRERKP